MADSESSNEYFDLSFLLEIADGSTEFIVESIDMFLQQTPELMQVIDSAIAEKDLAAVSGAAHKLKPNLGFFGMLGGQTLLQEIEILAKEGKDPALISTKFNELKGIVTPSLVILQKIKAEKESQL